MFPKKEENRRIKKEMQDKLKYFVTESNKQLEELDIDLDKKTRKLEDRNLLKKQQEVTMQLRQDNNKVNIDNSIAQSKINELEGFKEMTMSQLKEIIADKRKVDKENSELEIKIQGRGLSEQEQRAKQLDAEKEQILKVRASLKFQKETATNLMTRLTVEETKGKEMLDERIKLQQELN